MGMFPSSTQSPSKNYSICSYEPMPFSNMKSTAPLASFHFLELFAYCVPLSASLRTGFSQNENVIP